MDKTMIMKGLVIFVMLLGLVLLTLAGLAYFELQGVATSENIPTADSLPFTRVFGPELFDQADAGTKPAELARTALSRINTVAACGMGAVILGLLLLAASLSRRKRGATD